MSAEQQQEISTKVARVIESLRTLKQDALLIRRNENLAWITAGALTRRVRIPGDTNACSILITSEGARYYLTTNNEAARFHDEDLHGLGFEAIVRPWFYGGGEQEAIDRIVKRGSVASDQPSANGGAVVDLTPLRTPLLPAEIERFRSAGREVAAIVSGIVQRLTPGTTEAQMNAISAADLWTAGIEPSVLLMAVDDRILKYKHALASNRTLERYAMVNLCARKWGLCLSLTRFVHFGPLPQQLADAFGVAAEVNGALQEASRVGATGGELFSSAQQAYARAGFPGEEEYHHQGGPIGYVERDWIATPNGRETLIDAQGLAWNPSIRGGKVEDTYLLLNGTTELLTPTPELPQVSTRAGSADVISAGVLVR